MSSMTSIPHFIKDDVCVCNEFILIFHTRSLSFRYQRSTQYFVVWSFIIITFHWVLNCQNTKVYLYLRDNFLRILLTSQLIFSLLVPGQVLTLRRMDPLEFVPGIYDRFHHLTR